MIILAIFMIIKNFKKYLMRLFPQAILEATKSDANMQTAAKKECAKIDDMFKEFSLSNQKYTESYDLLRSNPNISNEKYAELYKLNKSNAKATKVLGIKFYKAKLAFAEQYKDQFLYCEEERVRNIIESMPRESKKLAAERRKKQETIDENFP